MKRALFLALAVLTAGAQADEFFANFDSFTEGDAGFEEITVGGIRFFDLQRDLDPGSNFFVVDTCTNGILDPNMSSPNVMGIGGYVPGDNIGFGRFKSFEITLAGGFEELRGLEFDFWTFNLNDAGNTVTLEGFKQGVLVDFDSFSPGSYAINHKRFVLPDDDYDRFVLHSDGPIDNGVVFAVFDNVKMTAIPVPEPFTLGAMGIGLAMVAMAKRRKLGG